MSSGPGRPPEWPMASDAPQIVIDGPSVRIARPLRFEHLIQVNDPLLPLLEPLTRRQLWHGLVRRAEDPAQFVPGLEGVVISARRRGADGTEEIERTLDFGSFLVHDQVELTPLQCTRTRVAATTAFPASRMTIRIEEPQPELLFLRFIYEFQPGKPDDADEISISIRRQAYRGADIDTVRRIRQLAEVGELG